MSRQLTRAEHLERCRQTLRTDSLPIADQLYLLDQAERVQHLERQIQSAQRKLERDGAKAGLRDKIGEIADSRFPGLGPYAAARKLKLLAAEPDELPPDVADFLKRLSERQSARIVRVSKRT